VARRICFVSSEVAPLAKSGGLADVSGALSRHLVELGHDVRLFMPLYAQIDTTRLHAESPESLRDIWIDLGPHRFRYSVLTAILPGSSTPVYLVHCPALFDRPTLYTSGPDEHLRFLLFSRAAIETCQRLGFAPEVFHLNDWHTGLIPVLLKTVYAWDGLFGQSRTLFTIHNIGYQGIFPTWTVPDLGLGSDQSWLHEEDLAAGKVNWLKHGVLYADRISTVSPTYAHEITTAEGGHGLDAILRTRGSDLTGILNGVDYDDWDPRTDRYLEHHFGPADLSGKQRTRDATLDWLSIPAAPGIPVLGIVSRLTSQKGFDLLFPLLPELLAARELRLLVLGSGEWRYEEFFTRLQHQFPDKVVFHRGYHEPLAHLIEAASDMFLMPSQYEPCGLNQMYSMRYGSIPVVRRTGGLADSVQMFDSSTGTGTGIVFDHFDVPAMRWALETALALHADRAAWARLVANAMAQDFSWERRVGEYVALYDQLTIDG
jgi:starch synthase